MQEIMICLSYLIGWMESAARKFTYSSVNGNHPIHKARKKVDKLPFFRIFMIKSLDSKETISCH